MASKLQLDINKQNKEYNMSIKIKGKTTTKSEPVKIHGVEATERSVPVNIHGDINRDTDGKVISKYLKDGWNWNLYVPISVAEFPEDSGIEMKLLDGDHRRHMFMLTFPDRTHIRANVFQVKNMQEYHNLFTKINLYNRKNATKEEVFVHDVKAFLPAALNTMRDLIGCGVCVHGSSDPGGIVGLPDGPRVKIGAFKRTVKHGLDNAIAATSLMKLAWPEDEELKAELMEALAILYKLCAPLRSQRSQIADDFRTWFITLSIYTQRDVAMDYKNSGGAVVNRHALCIARGILKDFRKITMPGGTTSKYKQAKLKLGLLDNLIDG